MKALLDKFLNQHDFGGVCDKHTKEFEFFSAHNLFSDWDTIKQRIDKNKKLVMTGTEPASNQMLQYLAQYGIKVDYVWNSFNNDETWEGIPLIDSHALRELKNEVCIIVTTHHYHRIVKWLWELELAQDIIGIMANLPLMNKDIVYQNADKIISTYELMADVQSQTNFIRLVKFRLTGNYFYILSIADKPSEQYFDKNIVHLSYNETFVDGGAFDGDTIERFLSHTDGKFNQIIAFEPDGASYDRLVSYTACVESGEIITKQAGLYKETTSLGFKMGDSQSSTIDMKSDTVIPVVRLDDYMNHDITFIKMDIEGSELDALEGAQNIIRQQKPLLAICVYHKLTDLWEIPLYIKSLVPSYKLYIRHYSHLGFESVCYAVDNSLYEK